MAERMNQTRQVYVAALLWEQINRMWEDKQLPLFMRADDWKHEERRVHPRIPCLLLVDYATQYCVYRDFIKNVSVGGAFIESSRLPIGPEITLTFSLFDAVKPLKITGQVVRLGPEGIGVRFRLGR